MSKYKEVTITPQMAKEMLKKNCINRPLSQNTINAYAYDMKEGNWDKDSDSAISFDTEGKLRNGQHRLNAIIKAGVPVTTQVCYGCSPDAIFDAGRRRSDRDQLNIVRSDLPASMRSTRFISMVRILVTTEQGTMNVGAKITSGQISQYIDDHYDRLSEFAPMMQSCVSKITITPVFYSLYLAYCDGISLEDISHFLSVLRTGMAEGSIDYPIIAYRNYLLSTVGSIHATTEEICKCQGALKKYLTKSSLRRLYIPSQIIWKGETA